MKIKKNVKNVKKRDKKTFVNVIKNVTSSYSTPDAQEMAFKAVTQCVKHSK